jgi:hypothetical protein
MEEWNISFAATDCEPRILSRALHPHHAKEPALLKTITKLEALACSLIEIEATHGNGSSLASQKGLMYGSLTCFTCKVPAPWLSMPCHNSDTHMPHPFNILCPLFKLTTDYLLRLPSSRLMFICFGQILTLTRFDLALESLRCVQGRTKSPKFLNSGSDVKGLDESLLAEFTEQQTLAINLGSQPYIPDDKLSRYEFGLNEPQQYLPETQLVIPDPLLDFAQTHGSSLTIDQDGRVAFNGSGDEMRDLIRFLLVQKRSSWMQGCTSSSIF